MVERGARASVIESYVTLAPGQSYLTNAVTEVAVGAGAWVEHTRIQRESESALPRRAHPRRPGTGQSLPLVLARMGGAIARHNLHVRLDDENIETLMYGLYLTRGEQVVDNHTAIYHDQPNCRSWEVYKGILDGRSRGVFNGKVFVKPEAQKTDAKQTNRNLLLSRRRRGRHQAAARDLRRRREVHPRRHGGPAGRARPLLPPEPRHSGGGRGPAPHLRLRRRGGGGSGARAGARGAGPPGARRAWAAV